jgi:tetratricopeptide (TPR) repeat protein
LALSQYTELRPKDENALRDLAGLYLQKANRLQGEAEIAQQNANYLTAGATFTDPLQLPGGAGALTQDPIVDAITTKANEVVGAAYNAAQTAYSSAADAYDKVIALAPSDPNLQLELAQTAQRAGDFPRAIAAYERFVELAPDDPSTAIVKRQIAQLKALGQTTVEPSG